MNKNNTYKITESIKYYFEVKPSGQTISNNNNSVNINKQYYNYNSKDDSYFNKYVNYTLLNNHLYKW
jgi:hypothetical protein